MCDFLSHFMFPQFLSQVNIDKTVKSRKYGKCLSIFYDSHFLACVAYNKLLKNGTISLYNVHIKFLLLCSVIHFHHLFLLYFFFSYFSNFFIFFLFNSIHSIFNNTTPNMWNKLFLLFLIFFQ